MSDDIDEIREAFRSLNDDYPTDLIGRLKARISSGACYYDEADAALDREIVARICELEKRLAIAEADALGAARVLSRASDEIRALKPKASE